MRAHVVRHGEYLTQICAKLGVDPTVLWNHPANAKLREKRQSKDILHPGN